MTLGAKRYARTLSEHGVKPVRIRRNMFESPAFDTADLPALRRFQNFVHYDCTVKSGNADNPEGVVALVNELRYTDNMDDNKAFAFIYEHDESGSPILGNGSDRDSFLIGVSTKRLLLNLRHTSTYLFRMDATFKVSQHDYQVIVCGDSDRSRAFYVVGFFITSQLTEARQIAALDSLMRKYQDVSGLAPAVKYCMGDADCAQRNAFATVSRELATAGKHKYLMCYYHVLANIEKRATKWPENAKALVYYHINLAHFSASKDEFKRRVQRAYGAWARIQRLPTLQTTLSAFE